MAAVHGSNKASVRLSVRGLVWSVGNKQQSIGRRETGIGVVIGTGSSEMGSEDVQFVA